jgi:hypothetical protein
MTIMRIFVGVRRHQEGCLGRATCRVHAFGPQTKAHRVSGSGGWDRTPSRSSAVAVTVFMSGIGLREHGEGFGADACIVVAGEIGGV